MAEPERMTESLWKAESQAGRLAELTSDDPAVKELPLRRDVRSLGLLLGRTLREQAGEALYDTVETLRRLTTEHRDSRRAVAGGAPTRDDAATDDTI